MSSSQSETNEVLTRLPTGKAKADAAAVHPRRLCRRLVLGRALPALLRRGRLRLPMRLSSPATAARRGASHLDSFSIADYVRDVAKMVEQPAGAAGADRPFDGRLRGAEVPGRPRGARRGADGAVPPQGLWAAALGLMFSKPSLMKDLNNLMSGGKAGARNPARGAVRAAGVGRRPEALLQAHAAGIAPRDLGHDAVRLPRTQPHEPHAAAGAGRRVRPPDPGLAGGR
jgi:hypothetical protein